MSELTEAPAPPPFQYEAELQQWLAANPDTLESGLWLVGYEFPLGENRIDLLGVDQSGQLVVIEVKRANATREAVGQVLDYVSALELMEPAEIAESINQADARPELAPVADFEREYKDRYGAGLADLMPVRALLACTSESAETERILEFLQDLEMDIDSVVFEGALTESDERRYRRRAAAQENDDDVDAADPTQQVAESALGLREPCRSPYPKANTKGRKGRSKIEEIHERAAGYPGVKLFRSIHCLFVDTFPEACEVPRERHDPKRQDYCGIAFSMPSTSEDWEHGRLEYFVVRLYPVGTGEIELFVYDRAEQRSDDAASLLDTLPERPLYRGKDRRVGVNGRNFWFTKETWPQHQANFEAVLRAIHEGWKAEWEADRR